MWKTLKRIASVLLVLATVALVLNLNIAGRPARDHAMDLWQREEVQKVYGTIRDRAWALIKKDISVEDVFKELPLKEGQKKAEKPSDAPVTPAVTPPANNSQVIDMENLSDQDRKDLERILQNSAKTNPSKNP